jgi:hypothetical protein
MSDHPATRLRKTRGTSAASQLCEEVNDRRRVKPTKAVVITTRPTGAIELRIIKPSHAVTKAKADGTRYSISLPGLGATYSSAAPLWPPEDAAGTM